MSSFNAPSTPSRSNRGVTGRAPSNFTVSFCSVVEEVLIPVREEEFIEYGSVVLVLFVGASIPSDSLEWPELTHFFRNIEFVITAYMFSREPRSYTSFRGGVVVVSGDLSPWGIRTSGGPQASDPNSSWETIMAIGEKVVEYLPVDVPNPNLDRGIQTVQVPCSFVGRVCGVPDTPLVAFKDIKPLLQRGVFVEIQFYLRRNEQGRDHLLRKGPLSFYVFLFFDKSAQLRYRWAFRDNTEILNLAVGQMVYCSGTIMGQLKEEFVVRAGYERGTPVNESPVLLVAPTVNLRPTDQGATRSTFDAAVVSSPPIETFQSKLERLRSRNQSNQSTKATSSQQFLDLTVEVPETDKDVGETGETGSKTPSRQESPSDQLTMDHTENAGSVELPGTEQSGNEPIEGADEQVSSDRGLLRKRRKRL